MIGRTLVGCWWWLGVGGRGGGVCVIGGSGNGGVNGGCGGSC